MEMRFAVVYEKAENNYGAWVPDLPGCVSTGKTLEETAKKIREAIALHIYGMNEDNEPIPAATTVVGFVDVDLERDLGEIVDIPQDDLNRIDREAAE